MAWATIKGTAWSDLTQDTVDDWLEKHGYNWEAEPPSTKQKKYSLLRRGLKDRQLKMKVDRLYKQEHNRLATVKEYKNLFRIGLSL